MKYEKLKNIYNSFFENFEVKISNILVRGKYNFELLFKYMSKEDKLENKYRQQIKKYWKKYGKRINLNWFKYYSSRNNNKDLRYIPDDIYYTYVDQYFNSRKYGWGVNDKNYYSLWFKDAKQPSTVCRIINGFYYDYDYNLLDFETAINKCEKFDKLIIKPSVETGGSKGIVFYYSDKGKSIRDILKDLNGKNYIIQELIEQHEVLNDIHKDSVNTIRIMSLLMENDVKILSSVLRMGINGSKVDNASAGGITCGIMDNGQLKDVAYTAHGIKYDKHPQGAKFNKYIVPSFGKAIEMVKKEHKHMAHFRLISWDIAIDRDGNPILIEANLRNGEIDFHQFNNGPLFGELTDEVLKEVFLNK